MKIIKVDDSNFASINLEVENKYKYLYLGNVYDFQGRSVENLRINTSSVTIKNLKITGQLSILEGTTHCKFENVVFKRSELLLTEEGDPLPLVSFGSSTVATIFEDCTFVGYDANKDFVMRASEYREYMYNGENLIVTDTSSVNDTLVMKNCAFKNLACAIWATKVSNCVIEGGWFEDVKCIVHNDGSYNEHNIEDLANNYIIPEAKILPVTNCSGINANVVINGIVIDNVNYIFRSRKADNDYTMLSGFNNIVINGVLGEVNSAVVDCTGGTINLEYNSLISSYSKLFFSDNGYYRHCNINNAGLNFKHKTVAGADTHRFRFTLKPKEVICPFGTIYVYKANWHLDNPTSADAIVNPVKVYVDKVTTSDIGYEMTNRLVSSNYSGVVGYNGNLKLYNNSTESKDVIIELTTYSKLI